MEKDDARERRIDYMEDTLKQALQEEFSAANNSTKLT
jgi:hypothetical protein